MAISCTCTLPTSLSAVRTDTACWVALLFKDFPHRGVISDFKNANLLTVNGVADDLVAERPGQRTPDPRKRQGVHTCVAFGVLVQDPQPNLIASAYRTLSHTREYEFAFPLMNDRLGNTVWGMDRRYQIAVLVGPTDEFQGVTVDTSMSDQIHLRIAGRATASLYYPLLPVAPGGAGSPPEGHRHV